MARKVLVADDSVTIQKVVGLTFANEDIELSFVDNGEEAITLAKQIKPDLILADVLMPGKSGYEVCENVKADPELQHIPVLLLTGTFEPFDADRCAQVGANGTITKPFESQTLIREVRELLDRPVNGKTPVPEQPAATQVPVDAAVASPEVPVDPMPETPFDPAPEPAFDSSPEPAWPEEDVPAEPGPAWSHSEAPAEPGPSWTRPAPPVASPSAEAEAPPSAPPVEDEGVVDAFDEDLAFSREPDLALNREAVDAPQTPEEGAPASWRSAPTPATPVEQPPVEQTLVEQPPVEQPPVEQPPVEQPPAEHPAAEQSITPESEDVWDLSDFESVDESQIEPLPEDALVEESEALWNEAAAEAIDLVETTNLEADNEAPVETGTAPPPSQDASLADALPELIAGDDGAPEALPADHEVGSAIGSSLMEGETEFEAFDLGPDGQGESLEIDAPVMDVPPEVPAPVADPAGFPAEATPAAEAPEAPAPESLATGHPAPGVGDDLASLTGLPSDRSTAIVSEAVKDAVEKFTWEAFGDLPETVVRAVQEKVEKIAWEVIPQMAETIIKEEIRRLKKEGK